MSNRLIKIAKYLQGEGLTKEAQQILSIAIMTDKMKAEEEPHLMVTAASTDKLQSAVTYWKNLFENLNEHYEKLKEQGATPALQQYWLHAALNAGMALRDIRWFNDHPHADLNATQGTRKHQLI